MNKLSIDNKSVSFIMNIEIIRLVTNILKFDDLIVISEFRFFSANCNFRLILYKFASLTS